MNIILTFSFESGTNQIIQCRWQIIGCNRTRKSMGRQRVIYGWWDPSKKLSRRHEQHAQVSTWVTLSDICPFWNDVDSSLTAAIIEWLKPFDFPHDSPEMSNFVMSVWWSAISKYQRTKCCWPLPAHISTQCSRIHGSMRHTKLKPPLMASIVKHSLRLLNSCTLHVSR